MAAKVKGELKIEFYAHLDEIKDLYFNQGIVIFKILHEKLVKKYHLSISYKMFCYYAKKELKVKKSFVSSIPKEIQEQGKQEEAHKPIVATFSMSDIQPFNPHTTKIDERKILK